MLKRKVLVGELGAWKGGDISLQHGIARTASVRTVDALAASAVASSEVAALQRISY